MRRSRIRGSPSDTILAHRKIMQSISQDDTMDSVPGHHADGKTIADHPGAPSGPSQTPADSPRTIEQVDSGSWHEQTIASLRSHIPARERSIFVARHSGVHSSGFACLGLSLG